MQQASSGPERIDTPVGDSAEFHHADTQAKLRQAGQSDSALLGEQLEIPGTYIAAEHDFEHQQPTHEPSIATLHTPSSANGTPRDGKSVLDVSAKALAGPSVDTYQPTSNRRAVDEQVLSTSTQADESVYTKSECAEQLSILSKLLCGTTDLQSLSNSSDPIDFKKLGRLQESDQTKFAKFAKFASLLQHQSLLSALKQHHSDIVYTEADVAALITANPSGIFLIEDINPANQRSVTDPCEPGHKDYIANPYGPGLQAKMRPGVPGQVLNGKREWLLSYTNGNRGYGELPEDQKSTLLPIAHADDYAGKLLNQGTIAMSGSRSFFKESSKMSFVGILLPLNHPMKKAEGWQDVRMTRQGWLTIEAHKADWEQSMRARRMEANQIDERSLNEQIRAAKAAREQRESEARQRDEKKSAELRAYKIKSTRGTHHPRPGNQISFDDGGSSSRGSSRGGRAAPRSNLSTTPIQPLGQSDRLESRRPKSKRDRDEWSQVEPYHYPYSQPNPHKRQKRESTSQRQAVHDGYQDFDDPNYDLKSGLGQGTGYSAVISGNGLRGVADVLDYGADLSNKASTIAADPRVGEKYRLEKNNYNSKNKREGDSAPRTSQVPQQAWRQPPPASTSQGHVQVALEWGHGEAQRSGHSRH